MSAGTHTPGPWTLEVSEKSARASILGPRGDGDVRSTDGLGTICTVKCATRETADRPMFPDIDSEALANARVMTAAPDMLDALKRLIEPAPGVSKLPPWVYGIVVPVIAKAEGRP